MRIKLIRTIRKPPWLKVWSAITAIALTVALVLTFLPVNVQISTSGLISIDLSSTRANPSFTARTETYFDAASLTTPFDATVDKPTGTAEGDILFSFIMVPGAELDSVPSGWNLAATDIYSTIIRYLYYKVAGASEPSSYTWSFSASAKVRIVCSCYTGSDFNAADPIDVVSNTAYRTSNTIVRAASMNVSAVNSPLVFFGLVVSTSSKTFTKPSVPSSDWVENDDNGSETSDYWTEICSMIWSGSGTTGDMDATTTATLINKHAFAVALNPAPAVVAPTVTTQASTDVLSTSCLGNGNITDTGGENCHTRGLCYMVGDSGDPTTADSKVYDNGAGSYGTGAYNKSITSLTESTYYRVRAYAINSAGTGYGDTVQVTTLPGDPDNLTDTAHNGVSIDFEWTEGTGADYTLIRYRTDQYPTGTSDGILGYNSTGNTTSVGSLSYGQIYYFRAWAWNSTTTLYSSGTSDRTCFTDPDAPTSFVVTETTCNSTALSWTKGTGADKTRVQYRDDEYPTAYDDGTQAYFDTGTSVNVTSLDSGQIYYFRAWSYDTESGYYDSYAQLTDYTLPGDPSALNAGNPTSTTIDVSWVKGTGGDKTMVRYAKVDYPAYDAGTQLYFDTGTSQQATSLNSSTTYYFRAWSYDSDSGYHSSGYSSDTETTLILSPEITNTPNTNDFGILAVNTTSSTAIDYFTITNTGNCTVDITIQGTDATGGDDTWTLSDTATPNENVYGLKAGLSEEEGSSFHPVTRTDISKWGGDYKVPTSDDSVDAEWTTSPYYSKVDETTPSTADYIQCSTSDKKALFGHTAFSVASGKGDIHIRVRYYAKYTGTSAKLKPVIKVNGTEYSGTEVDPTTDWASYIYSWETNPDTGLAWTVDDANGSGPHPLQTFGVRTGTVDGTAVVATVHLQATWHANCWVDIDDAIVPDGATGVIIKASFYWGGSYFGIRKKGSTDTYIGAVSDDSYSGYAIGTDSNGDFQLYIGTSDATPTGWSRISQVGTTHLYIVGYTTSGVTFLTNASTKTPAGTGWSTIDCSSECPSGIGAFFLVITTNYAQDWGFRKYGSSDNRYEGSYFSFAVIGLDTSQRCQGYLSATGNINFYLVGYITDGAIFDTNATDVSLSATYAWADLAALSSNATMGLYELIGSYSAGIRKKGDTADDATGDIGGANHCWIISPCDDDELCQGFIDDTNLDFFQTGYATKPEENYDIIIKKNATYNTLVSDLAEDATQDWGLKIYMPTSVNGYDAQEMSATITLVASAS